MKLNYSLLDFPGMGQCGIAQPKPTALPYATVDFCQPLTPFQKSVDSPPDVI